MLPDLSRLALRKEESTGYWKQFDDGPWSNVAPEILPHIVRAQVNGVFEFDDACWTLSQLRRQRETDPQLKEAIDEALNTNGFVEAFSQRILRDELNFAPAEGLPGQYATWTDLMLLACTVFRNAGHTFPEQGSIFWRSRKIVLRVVNTNGMWLQFASERLRADPHVVLTAVRQSGNALRYASPALQDDHDMVLAAVIESGEALQFASEGIRTQDRVVVLAAVQKLGYALEYAGPDMQNDEEIVTAAIQTSGGYVLRHAGPLILHSKRMVLFAVQRSPGSLMFAADWLKSDKEVVLAAVSQVGWALEYASEELKNDKEVALVAVRKMPMVLQYLSEELRADKELRRAAGWD